MAGHEETAIRHEDGSVQYLYRRKIMPNRYPYNVAQENGENPLDELAE